MKKIKQSDLSLKKDTVSELSENSANSNNTVNATCFTCNTCQTRCGQATCHGYSDDPATTCNATYNTVCLCASDNMQCESKTCNPSATDGPVCCEPPEPSIPTGICQATGDCPNSLEVICEQTIQGENGNTCVRVTEKCDPSDNCMHISIAVDDGYICELITRDNCEE